MDPIHACRRRGVAHHFATAHQGLDRVLPAYHILGRCQGFVAFYERFIRGIGERNEEGRPDLAPRRRGESEQMTHTLKAEEEK